MTSVTNRHQPVPPPTPDAPAVQAGRSLWGDAIRRVWRGWGARLCVFIFAFYCLLAAGGAIYRGLARMDNQDRILTFEEMKDYKHTNEGPSLRHWSTILGTDWAGRPVLIKAVLGAQVSITVGLIANLIAVPIGMFLGALAGYYGGAIDKVVVWLFSTLASIPGIVLLIAIKYAFTNVKLGWLDLGGIHGVYIALGVISWIGVCRLVRAETLKVRELDYVVAARAAGRGGLAILARHVLPNVMHLGIIRFSLGFVGAVQAEVILSYLGLGVEVGQPSWGTMITNASMDIVAGRYWEPATAVAAIFFLVLSLNILGDRLRDALDPKLRNV